LDRAEVEQHRAETLAGAVDERSAALHALTAELAAVEDEAEALEGKQGQAAATVGALKAAVLDLFHRCGYVAELGDHP
jgi:chromosome segregation ATPase